MTGVQTCALPISVVSRQGTNSFHGAAWEFLRNDRLNARSFFQAVRPRVVKNQFGAAAGGPIVRDKAFIFGSFELARDRSQSSSTSAQPPSSQELEGDFSHLTAKQLVDPSNNMPFPGNRIPRSFFDPAAVKLLGFVPVGASPTTLLQALGPNPRNARLFMLRQDLNVSANQTQIGRAHV